MPEKRRARGCGPSCPRCWLNNLKHGNPEAKRWLAKNKATFLNSWADPSKHTHTPQITTKE